MGNIFLKPACLAGKEDEYEQEEEDQNSPLSLTCGICMETMSKEKKFKMKKCSHPFCVDCISKHILYEVQDHNARVKCPHVGCTNLLDPLSCRSILPVETFVRWCDVICETTSMQSPSAYCPFTDCSELVLDECERKVTARKVQCPSCKRLFCFLCKVPWHAGYRCGEAGIRRDRDEEMFDRLVEKKRWQRCPECSACVEVIAGCSVVTCRCKNLFCYRCGAKHTRLHSFTCPFVWIQDYPKS